MHKQDGNEVFVNLGLRRTRGLHALMACADPERRQAQPHDLRGLAYDNPNLVAPRYPFLYEDPNAPGLAVLRNTYSLQKVVDAGCTELEKLVLLRGWVKKRWIHAAPDVPDHACLNALDLLRLAREGKRFYCHHYALTYVQCCLALGWQARMLGIFRSDFGGHNVAEVWCDTFGKWIVMDPDYDCHYEHDGVPMNALELHRAWQHGRRVVTSAVQLSLGSAGADSEQQRQILSDPVHLVNYYHRFFLFMGNAFFGADPGLPITAITRRRLRWFDSRTPKGMSTGCRNDSGSYYTDTFSNRAEDFYWMLPGL